MMKSTAEKKQRTFKRCTACGHPYTREEWLALPLVGEISDEVERGEHRNCSRCASTIAVSTLRLAALYRVERTDRGIVVFRRMGEAVGVELGPFETEADADARVARELGADCRAARRLGIELYVVANDDGEG